MPDSPRSTSSSRPPPLVKGHRIALAPTNRQASLLGAALGLCPVRRQLLNTFKAGLDRGEWLSDMDGCSVHWPRIGRVRRREEQRFDGDILGVTVSRMGGRWFASFTVDTGQPAPDTRPGPDIGIDMGVQTLATVWDGEELEEIANPKALTSGSPCAAWTRPSPAASIRTAGTTHPGTGMACTPSTIGCTSTLPT